MPCWLGIGGGGGALAGWDACRAVGLLGPAGCGVVVSTVLVVRVGAGGWLLDRGWVAVDVGRCDDGPGMEWLGVVDVGAPEG